MCGLSMCDVSFLGLRVRLSIMVCDLHVHAPAIIGSDILGMLLPHTLDVKQIRLFADEGVTLQPHHRDATHMQGILRGLDKSY